MKCWNNSSELRTYVHKSIKEIGLRPSKFSGQNFLVDANVINFQIQQAEINPKDTILEIGGGIGNLTKCLVNKAKKVYVIEFDRRLYAFLNDKFSIHKNVEIILGDAVKVEWPSFTKCVANLPYQISSPFTFKLLNTTFEKAIILYQKEFALRMQAKPNEKHYSRLSVMVQFKAICRYLKTIKATSFYPSPKVESALIELKPRTHVINVEEELFQFFVTKLFNNKKQLVRKVVTRLCKNVVDTEETQKLLQNLPMSDRRIFTLSLENLLEIFECLKDFLTRI
ncbi:MAG: 16S rRNA (adenine(1518)-N(6)/adenine(1519)-N(6))-dimethyltransferase RsmA [Candidatus Heimdallarchaeaceae archaeon]